MLDCWEGRGVVWRWCWCCLAVFGMPWKIISTVPLLACSRIERFSTISNGVGEDFVQWGAKLGPWNGSYRKYVITNDKLTCCVELVLQPINFRNLRETDASRNLSFSSSKTVLNLGAKLQGPVILQKPRATVKMQNNRPLDILLLFFDTLDIVIIVTPSSYFYHPTGSLVN